MAGKAFVYAACEDFGIAPVEAQACGTPVIAYGLELETVRDISQPADWNRSIFWGANTSGLSGGCRKEAYQGF